MAPESFELAQAWLRKASSDLATARILILGERKYLDVGAYHCQQTAEKALKAYLTARETVFPKTHVLERLVELCSSSGAGFEQFQRHAKELTPLANQFRYPDDASEPTPAEATAALRMAEEMFDFCEQQLRDLSA